ERTGEVVRRIRLTQQGVADRRAGSAKGNGLETGTILRGQGKADMPALADNLGVAGAVGGKGKDRHGVAGAEGPRLCQIVHQIERGAARGERGGDSQGGGGTGGRDIHGELFGEEGAERAKLTRLDGDACRHCMTAALGDQTEFHRLDDGAAKIDTGHRAARASACAVGTQSYVEGGALEALAASGRDEAGYATVTRGCS